MKSWVRNLAVICFFIILVIPSLATSQLKEEELRTQGWSNGKEWERLDVQSKNCYLSGIEDGIFLLNNELFSRTNDIKERNRLMALEDEFRIKGFRFGDLRQQVDKFYEDRSNIRIPIAYAYFFVIKKMHGTKQKDLDEYASELRKVWNK